MELLRKAGCHALFIGLESINQRSLNGVKKSHNNVEEYEALIDLLGYYDIPVLASIVLGLDEDDYGTIEETIRFLKRIKLKRALINIITPFPGTELHRQFERENRILHKHYSLYDGAHVVVRPKRMTPEELQKGLNQVQLELYSLNQIIKRLTHTKLRDVPLALVMNLVYRKNVLNNRTANTSGVKLIQRRLSEAI